MCSICNQQKCAMECPNYEEKAIYLCATCGEGITQGERYYKIGRSYYHKDCLLDCYDKDELLALVGAVPRRAGLSVSCVFIGVYDAEQNK